MRRTRIRHALFGLFMGTAAQGCIFLVDFDDLQKGGGGTGGSAGSDAGFVPLNTLSKEYANAICDHLRTCAGPATSLILGDEDCDKYFDFLYQDTLFVTLGGLPPELFEYHGEAMPACLDAVRNGPCTAYVDFPEQCEAALVGKVLEGGECTHPAECERGLYCNISSCPGKCTRRPGEGEPCAGKVCAEGLVCDDRLNKICVKLVDQVQAPCGGGTLPLCALDKYCVGQQQDTPGKCLESDSLFSAGLGQACNLINGFLCAQGLSCELNGLLEITNKTYDGTCTELSDANGPCKLGLPDPCPPKYYCKPGLGMIDGSCTALPKPGEACATDSTFKTECAPDTRCDSDTQKCVALTRLDLYCPSNDACYSSFCSANLCKPPNFCGG